MIASYEGLVYLRNSVDINFCLQIPREEETDINREGNSEYHRLRGFLGTVSEVKNIHLNNHVFVSLTN
jgi:hypothetical protein